MCDPISRLVCSKSDFKISVYAGGLPRSGGASATLVLHGQDGQQSEEITIHPSFDGIFERGKGHEEQHIPRGKNGTLNKNSEITKIEVKANPDAKRGWFLDKIVVENQAHCENYTFYIFSEIKRGKDLEIYHPSDYNVFTLYIYAGILPPGGTASAYVILYADDDEGVSEEIEINPSFTGEMKRGEVHDKLVIPKDKMGSISADSSITSIAVKECPSDLDPWFLDKVVVKNKANMNKGTFPFHRLVEGVIMCGGHDTTLPQYDLQQASRKKVLDKKRQDYQFVCGLTHEDLLGPVGIKELPKEEDFSTGYKVELGIMAVGTGLEVLYDKLSDDKWKTIEDMKDIYFKHGDLYLPKFADKWDDDVHFAQQRLVGCNYSLIKLVESIPEKLPVDDMMLQSLMDGLSIKEAIGQKKLFMVDLEILHDVKAKENFSLCAPIGLFFRDASGTLNPIAIQLYQIPGPENPIFTPEDSYYTWNLAKLWFNNADAAYHESIAHLGFTHLVMGGISIAAHRELSTRHPIFKLLAPHFLYMISINFSGMGILLGKGAFFDKFMNPGAAGMDHLICKKLQTWRLNVEGCLPEDLKARGVKDSNVLPTYYYRDDAMLLYTAIQNYVKAYVELYYSVNDISILKNDKEIQAWAKALVDERKMSGGGVGLLGVPGNGAITSNDQLIDIVTCVIFTCSVTHGSVNFPQYEEYGFPPKYPAMLRGKPIDKKGDYSESDIMKCLGTEDETFAVMKLTRLLSMKATNSMGDFEVKVVYDPPAKALIKNFRKELKDVSAEIKRRNQKRPIPYEYCLPEDIPNSISI